MLSSELPLIRLIKCLTEQGLVLPSINNCRESWHPEVAGGREYVTQQVGTCQARERIPSLGISGVGS